jgi:hypothetical protein
MTSILEKASSGQEKDKPKQREESFIPHSCIQAAKYARRVYVFFRIYVQLQISFWIEQRKGDILGSHSTAAEKSSIIKRKAINLRSLIIFCRKTSSEKR